MSRKIFQRKEYSIYRCDYGYVIENGHTHVNNFYKAKILVIMAIKREIDDKLSKRDIQSLIRLTNDNRYRNKLLELERSGINGEIDS